MKTTIRDVITTFLVAVVIYFLMQATIQVSIIQGSSMEPSLHGDVNKEQRLLISKAVYFFEEPKRGEIVVFWPPEGRPDDKPYIKRIIGLPGETVAVTDGQVLINGEPLYEPYIMEPPAREFGELTIPGDSYFVLGDNRNHSNDSRGGWTVPRHEIIGKAWLSIWPPPFWGLVPHYEPE